MLLLALQVTSVIGRVAATVVVRVGSFSDFTNEELAHELALFRPSTFLLLTAPLQAG